MSMLVNARQAAVHPKPVYRRISKIAKSQCELEDCDEACCVEKKRPFDYSMRMDFVDAYNRFGHLTGKHCKMVDDCQEFHRMPTSKTCWVCVPNEKMVFTTNCCG